MSPFLAHAQTVGVTLLPVAAVFAVLALVTKRGGLLSAAWRGRREMLTNAGLVVVNYILLAPIMLVPVIAVRGVLPVPPALVALWSALPDLGVLALAILAIEFAAYWRHRIEHQPGLWRFHATHHADEELNWFSVLRKHPVSKFIELLVDTLPVLLLGMPAWALVGAQLTRSWWGYFIHADVPWTLGPASRVLMSPAAHRLHHIRDETLMGSNYGNMLTLWDRLFGTWRDPAPHLNCVTGIAEGTRGIWGELARPWEARYRSGAQVEGGATSPA
ncbi:MAG TPA: sterol desaturase family protein [Qipengyuania sp.]|nr:sterol desaturase family protein [Qipengyuania sp.]